jgi:hypothetical protein
VIASHLYALGKSRAARTWLEAKIKEVEAPHLEAAKAASAAHRELLRQAKERENSANDAARETYLRLTEERRAALLAGNEAPGIELPEGWTAQLRDAVEIIDASAVPRSLCNPDPKAVERALKEGAAVPGATLIVKPFFVRSK